MKPTARIAVALLLLCGAFLSGCQSNDNGKPADVTTPEQSVTTPQENTATPDPDTSELRSIYQDYLRTSWEDKDTSGYAFRDIDNDGTEELLVCSKGTEIIVFRYQTTVQEIGRYDYQTGTTRFLATDDYPGIFCFYVGGGNNSYDYISVENGTLKRELLWQDRFAWKDEGDPEREVYYTEDTAIISASKKAYAENADVDFQLINELK